MNLPILSHIYTQEDRAFVLSKLEKLEQSSFSVKSSFEESVHEVFSLSVGQSLLESAKSAEVSLLDPGAVQRFLHSTQAEIKAVPVITVCLAFTPSYDLLRSITKWFDAECRMKIITEYRVDPSIVGGVAIELNGKYIDYSLKKLIDQKLSAISGDKASAKEQKLT